MDTLSYKTLSANKETANKEWLLVDAEGQSLGRLASKVAKLLRGKHKPNFTPHADCGDFVVVVNSDKINLTGKKWSEKVYERYTGFPGGQRSVTAEQVHDKDATRLVERAVKGMLPKNKLGRAILKNLRVYEGAEHQQDAQQPRKIDINEFK
ncbi:50S ribosomal protein L13 [Weeksellaceae bacterium TAE3-ERU29]|nr:50S ribosomal protein L13 [Weeksellaceae bacterium TAE3-ERU29]